MKTRRFTLIFRMLLTLLTGCLVWYAVAELLEPRPLWVRRNTEMPYFYPCSYDEDAKLLVAIESSFDVKRPYCISDVCAHVLDAQTGKTTVSLPLNEIRFRNRNNHHLTPIHPHIVRDRIFRFALRLEEDKEFVELRCWDYRTDKTERLLHTWQVDLGQWWAEWSMEDPSRFHIVHCLPWLPCAMVPASCFLEQHFGHLTLNTVLAHHRLIESWQLDESTGKPTLQSQWLQPPWLHRFVTRNVPGKWLYSDQQRRKIVSVDLRTGQVEVLPVAPISKFMFGVCYSDRQLLMIRNYEEDTAIGPNGKPEKSATFYPVTHSKVNWTLEQWRALYDARSGKRISWPSELDVSIVGFDWLIADAQQPDRYLHQSNLHVLGNDSNNAHSFQLMKLQDGKLELVASWKTQTIDFSHQIKFNHHILALINEQMLSSRFYSSLPQYAWLQEWLMRVFPPDRQCVAWIDETNGSILWRAIDREIVNTADVIDRMTRDFVLLTQSRMTTIPGSTQQVRISDYECWAFPFVVYSPWWARAAGCLAALALWLALVRLRHVPHQPPVPT